MTYRYGYGPSLSDQGVGPDDIEYIWICGECQVEEWTPGPLPRGWETIMVGPDGSDYAFICDRCRARL